MIDDSFYGVHNSTFLSGRWTDVGPSVATLTNSNKHLGVDMGIFMATAKFRKSFPHDFIVSGTWLVLCRTRNVE